MAERGPISRQGLDAGRVDFSGIDSIARLAQAHLGDVPGHDFSAPLGRPPHTLAIALRVPPNRITAILAGARAVTAETALRLARHFGTSAGFRVNLQKSCELEVAERTAGFCRWIAMS